MIRRRAVIVDTETTDLHGRICEIAVVDVDGVILLDTLVNPCCAISDAATAVHGLRDLDVATAPTLSAVLPTLLEVTRGRPILAYNAPYDREALLRDLARLQVLPEHLAHAKSWGCLMRALSTRTGQRWQRLGGGHRALGDAQAARAVLHTIAT